MENQSQNKAAVSGTPAAGAKVAGQGSASGTPNTPGAPKAAKLPKASNDVFLRKITEKIKSSENILVALSSDPSVDEMAAAIGLTLFLDGLQKHTTAIYSGKTPDALQFLQPEGTFETNTDSLQDFIIALNKEKADHLRYKLDGDFVKVYITPYKSNITADDLEFSHGDFNVNLVLALGVPTAADLDSALAEHGRIMHDATTVDITTDAPGKFAEIEWSDPGASSVSEMVTKLIFAMQGDDAVLDKETATALLTGIVAATGRFSNDRTNSDTMQLASKLMAMGADQQLISAHVMDNKSPSQVETVAEVPRTDLAVGHDTEMAVDNGPEIAIEGAVVTPVMESAQGVQAAPAAQPQVAGSSRADLAAAATAAVNEAVATAAANAAAAGAVSPAVQGGVVPGGVAVGSGMSAPVGGASMGSAAPVVNPVPQVTQIAQGVMSPLPPVDNGGAKSYADMIAEALAEESPEIVAGTMPAVDNSAAGATGVPMADASGAVAAPVVDVNTMAIPGADVAGVGMANGTVVQPVVDTGSQNVAGVNPAMQAAPAMDGVARGPEPVANPNTGVTLPPPPAPLPTADMMPPALPNTQPAAMNVPTAATQSDAFQIPGMS